MSDMLVKLYDLSHGEIVPGICIRKPIGPEKHAVIEYVRRTFGGVWPSEVDVALGNHPSTCFIAIKDKSIVGFAAYDATARGYFGPTGVSPQFRKQRIGTALLLESLRDMRSNGYGYAIIGMVGPTEFYAKTIGAVEIAGSDPGIWKDMVKQ